MSGDVQPRKRKDKKKKKDELGLEEPRGTAAALGEGDVFMHSYSDHGTGGHWCAKIIFFSLLAVLVTLIGLIILENRGLSELEANSVESQYSNLLEGWLEDAPEDDHHDEHTLELKHPDDEEEDDHYDSHDVGDHDDDEHTDEDDDEDEIGNNENEDDDEHGDEDEIENDENEDEDDDEHGDEDEIENDENEDEDDDEHGDENENENNENDDEDDDEHGDEDENDAQLVYDDENEHFGDNDDESVEQDEDEQADEEDENTQNDKEDSRELAADEDEDDRSPYKYYSQENEDDDDDETGKDDDEQDTAEEEDEKQYVFDDQDRQNENESNEELGNEDIQERDLEGDEDEGTNENDNDDDEDDEHEDHEHDEEDDELEVEKIEREASEEEEPIIIGLPALPEEDDDDDDKDAGDEHDDDDDADGDVDADDDFLEADVPPVVERVSAPAGKPFKEIDDDDDSTEKPPDTLEEEEEYEKLQEEKRKEEEQSSHHIWLKLSVGAALLVATLSVLRRATAPTASTAPRDEAAEEIVEREETPIVDRRMTLIPSQAAPPVIPKKEIVEDIVRREAPVVKAPVVIKQDSDEEGEEPELEEVVEEEEVEEDEPEKLEAPHKEQDKELYSDEEIEEEEEVIIPKKETPKAAAPKSAAPAPKTPEPEEEEDPDDVEIIDDETLEEEMEEEEDVSDVDDSELLSRLEAKYGRLPEPDRPGQRQKDGGNSVEDMWAGEPADAYWRQQLDSAERDLRQGAWSAAAERASATELRSSARARYVVAAALDRLAEARRDNSLLSRAIAAYFDLLEMSERLSDKKLVEIARRTLDRIQFRGNYLKAEPVYRILIRRFPDEPAYRNNLTVSFLMAGRNDLAESTLKETLARWPDDRVALVHYAFILKTTHKNRLEEAIELFQKALEGDKGPACEPRFYYHYGDALLLLGRFKEAHEVHKRAAKLGHFLSSSQRSLYNVPRLKSSPWWNVNDTPYSALARNLEMRWKEILKEGQKAAALYEKEKEGLKERGEWSQMDLFVRGQEIPGRCSVAPVTCSIVKSETAAAGCRRGQVKFSLMSAGTHVRPHVGPTNCRLRMHLALSNTKDTFLRVDQETRQWQEGKVLLFDDSFEHEVWHNGTAARLVLIVDVWHPGLTPAERRTLPPI